MQVKLGGNMRYQDFGPVDRGLRVNTHGFSPMWEEGVTYKTISERSMDARKQGRLVAPRHTKTRALTIETCPQCSIEYMPFRTTQRYCSVKCQKRAAKKRFNAGKATGRIFRKREYTSATNTCGHPERPHRANGQCAACYGAIWKKQKRARLRNA